MAIIVASALGAWGFVAMLAIALGRAAAIADEQSAQSHAERSVTPSVTRYRTQRLPVSSCTSRRPGIRLKTPGSSPQP